MTVNAQKAQMHEGGGVKFSFFYREHHLRDKWRAADTGLTRMSSPISLLLDTLSDVLLVHVFINTERRYWNAL